MTDIYKKQIEELEDLEDIAILLTEKEEYNKAIKEAISNGDSGKVPAYFPEKGVTIYVIGRLKNESDLVNSAIAIDAIEKCIEQGLITSVTNISNDGLFISLLQACAPKKVGFDITGDSEIEDKEFLFGKSQHVAIIGVTASQEDELVDYMFDNKVPITLIGHVTKGDLRLDELEFGKMAEYMPLAD